MKKPTTKILRECIGKLNTSISMDGISDKENLYDRGVLDSINIIPLVLLLEAELGFEFSYEQITHENFSSISNLLVLLDARYEANQLGSK
jgi:acyl carrier protein